MIEIGNLASEPITTNKLRVEVNKEDFFSKYAIVSYYSLDKTMKNLAYERLATIPFISVTGIRARWNDKQSMTSKFFVLAERTRTNDVLKSLRIYDTIRSQEDDLSAYDEKLQKRVIASLAVNSLGGKKNGRMMYSDGSLLLCDDKNYLIPQSRNELVCLKIEVNEYLNLIARTATFSNPSSLEKLEKRKDCVFHVTQDVYGQWWSGLAVNPIVIKDVKQNQIPLSDLFIKKKKFSKTHNVVPYWPYNPENYTHGRLFAIAQVLESVNKKYKGLVNLEFEDFVPIHFDQYRPEKDMLACIVSYFDGRCISFEDPFGTSASKQYIHNIKTELSEVVNTLQFPRKRVAGDMLIKLVEPKDAETIGTHYTQSLYRLAHNSTALQHVVYSNDEKEDKFGKTEARRLLVELYVKDCLINRKISLGLNSLVDGWEFVRYKINQGNVLGASLSIEKDGSLNIKDFGIDPTELPIDFDSYSREYLQFKSSEKLLGARDYMVIKKDRNVYLIIDTDEIPILNPSLIDEGYKDIAGGEKPLAFFKRKGVAHKYLGGYVGFHLWRTDGLDGEKDESYSYIAGSNNDNLQIKMNTKMDKMPRARRIFVLHKDNAEVIESHMMEFADMLKFGFGRWNEMMTYPFPFKFLQEYLDDVCETAFCKHWSEITFNGDLC